jgi:prepilin-type N-terminal cleavage/methylation domain-containing protein
MRKNGFTLVELLAVIVVFGIILVIAIPSIINIISDATMDALESDAKMVLKQLEYEQLKDSNFNATTINTNTITNLSLSNSNYDYLKVGMNGESPYIFIRGKNKWNGLVACGTADSILVYKVGSINYCESNFDYTGSVQTYTVPQTGTYQIELWGAQGGSFDAYLGAMGAYVSGQIDLTKDTQLFLYVGSLGATVCNPYTSCPNPVFNGGAQGGYFSMGSYQLRDSSGGGATDVRLTNGSWSDTASLRSRIMVAGAGGGGAGGYGGALTGGNGITGPISGSGGAGGSQTAGGSSSRYAGTFGLGGMGYVSVPNDANNNDGYGGGGGYYGGGGGYGGIATTTSSGSVGPGGGGSSFISGYTGCNAIDSSGNHTGQPNHYSGYVFTNGVMTAGNTSMVSPSGDAETGHSGNGYARITYIGVR